MGRIILCEIVTARGKKKRADYVLFYKNNFLLAVIEEKDKNNSVEAMGIGNFICNSF